MTAPRWPRVGLLMALAALGSVAWAQASAPTPASTTGRSVVIEETAIAGGRGGSTFFVVVKVDGREVANSMDASTQSSRGRGPDLQVVTRPQVVPSGSVTLTLAGQYLYGMPIAQVFSGGTNAVSGEVRVELSPDKRYRVNGVLDPYRSEVWLEEIGSGQIVGTRIVRQPTAKELAEFAGADRYTCCNLHYGEGWISNGNWAQLPVIPAGARVRITGWGRYRAHVNIEGRSISAGVDYGRETETREQFADKIFVKEDPRPRIATFPPEAQAAIAAGKVRRGMTKEQVVVALGYPRRDRTPEMAAARQWVYFVSETAEFELEFDAAERVSAINAASRVSSLVWLPD